MLLIYRTLYNYTVAVVTGLKVSFGTVRSIVHFLKHSITHFEFSKTIIHSTVQGLFMKIQIKNLRFFLGTDKFLKNVVSRKLKWFGHVCQQTGR